MGSNVNRNLHKVVYKKLEKKRRDRRRLFSVSLSFYQTNLQSCPQSRYMFDIKKLLLIDALETIPGETRDLLRTAIADSSRVIFTIFLQVKLKQSVRALEQIVRAFLAFGQTVRAFGQTVRALEKPLVF